MSGYGDDYKDQKAARLSLEYHGWENGGPTELVVGEYEDLIDNDGKAY